MPDNSTRYPRPTKILGKSVLKEVWLNSRDSRQSGTSGVDKQTTKSFASNLDDTLAKLARQLGDGEFGFSPLRPFLIPKEGSKKFRLICVPTVRDRLVQRAIAKNIQVGQKLPMNFDSSFGFVQDKGLASAISRVLELRAEFDFVFETDISSFFDQIDRKSLVVRVERQLRRSSLLPLLKSAIGCEITPDSTSQAEEIKSLGISPGLGLRQGMPLSPLLANYVLAPMDRAIASAKIPMVRYADDIVIFANSEKQAIERGDFLRAQIEELGHTIPELDQRGKTKVVSKFEPLQFLGREFIFMDRVGDFVQRVSDKKLLALLGHIADSANVESLIKNGIPFNQFTAKINQTAASYISTYSDAHNAVHVENEVRRVAKESVTAIYESIFGPTAVSKMAKRHREFLGLNKLDLDGAEILSPYEY